MSEKTKERPKFTGIYIMLVVLIVGVMGSVSLGVLSLINNKAVMAEMHAQLVEEDEETKENDVTIAEQYMIVSTEHISEAYKSGDKSKLNDKDKETLDMAAKVLDEIITTDMSNYEKEKAVYDWMTHNLQNDSGFLTVIPTTQEDSDNPYGVLKYHNAVCVGYATTFRLFMQMLDVPCMVVHNTEYYHSWNIVQLDENWYHTDIYADAGSGNYSNFNINDIMRSREQNWDSRFFPVADSLKYNMAYQTAKKASDIYSLPQKLRAAIDEGESILSLKFDSDLTENDAKIAVSMIEQIQNMMWSIAEYENVHMDYSWNPVEEGYLLAVYVQNYNEGNINISEEDLEKVENAINEAFGDLGFDDSFEWDSDDDFENWDSDKSWEDNLTEETA